MAAGDPGFKGLSAVVKVNNDIKEVGMVIFRDCTDEVDVILVEPEAFNEIKELLDSLDAFYSDDNMDDMLEKAVEAFLTTNSPHIIEKISTQTFCYDDIDWGKYKIKGLLTFPW
jgi:hypothetical protein